MKKLFIARNAFLVGIFNLASLPALMAINAPEISANWPQWRGPDGQGVSTEKGLPTEWNATRNIKWKTPIAGRGHSSPIVWGDRVFLTAAIEGDVIPGAKPPKHILGSGEYVHPVAGHGIAIFSAAHPVKRAIAIRLGGSGDVTGTSQIVWQRDKGTGYTPSSILYGDYAYLLTDGGILTCIDVKTGEVKYEGARAPRPGRFYASPVAFEDKILLTSETGDAFVMKAGPKHEVLQTNSLDEPIYASPAIAKGAIFIRTTKHLYCIENEEKK